MRPVRPVVVVGAALVRDEPRAVLASRRTGPPELAGRWEFPGGKVEAGESEVAALVRELREELAVEADIGPRLGPDLPIGTSAVLRVYLARLRAGVPRLVDHDEHRWLAPDELHTVAWLPVDLPLLGPLRAALTAG